MNNMFTVTMGMVASTGTYVGVGVSRSPVVVRRKASQKMWDALYKGDREAGFCSGIAVEYGSVERYGKVLDWMRL
jgi:hypothetical protein